MDYSRFLNELSLNRKPSPLREMTKLMACSPIPITNFSNGFPNVGTFPFESISIKFKDGKSICLDGSLLNGALQYGPTDGYPQLLSILKDYQRYLHNPPLKDDWSILVTSGSQDGMCKAFEMLLNPGDYVIGEEYLYTGTVAIIRPYSTKHLKVKGDENGMRPDSLREVLSRWDPDEIRHKREGIPKILYIVPNGGNPVGTSTSADRRQEIYKIAQQYNLIIIEDDPYYFIQFSQNQRSPSFLSLDVDGRVLRFDSFSKILSGGLRAGYVTGPQQLVQRLVLHQQASQLHVSTLSQVIVQQLLSLWKIEGFMEHNKGVAQFYKSQRDLMLRNAKKYLTGLAEWNIPECGMFLWIRVLGVDDTANLISNRCLSKQIAFMPGKNFTLNSCPSPYVRACFSSTNDEEMNHGFRLFAEAIREELAFIKKNSSANEVQAAK